jgi:hypothetical protein
VALSQPAPKLTAGDVMASHPIERSSGARLTAEVAQDLDPGSGRLSGAIDHLGRQALRFLPRTCHKTYTNRCFAASLREVVIPSVASRATVRSLAMISGSRGENGPSV